MVLILVLFETGESCYLMLISLECTGKNLKIRLSLSNLPLAVLALSGDSFPRISERIRFRGESVINNFILKCTVINQHRPIIIGAIGFNNRPMIRKKNYKEEEHFTQLHTFTVFAPATVNQPAKKYSIYFKRYRKQQQSSNLYDLIHGGKQGGETEQATNQYSEDRTLELISFDGNLAFLKRYLRKMGKIRQYEIGQGIYKGQKIHTAMCVFKFEFDLVKCFRDDYLQAKMDEQCLANSKTITQQDRESERFGLIEKHMEKELGEKVQRLKEMQKDGFQVVTDIYGQYRMDFQANQKFVQDLPQIKRRRKKEKKQAKLKAQLIQEKRKEEVGQGAKIF